MSRLKIKLPTTTVIPTGWDDADADNSIIMSTDEDGDASAGLFNTLFQDHLDRFFLAVRDYKAPEDLRDLPFSAFRQIDTLTMIRWVSDVFSRFEDNSYATFSISGGPAEALRLALDMVGAQKGFLGRN